MIYTMEQINVVNKTNSIWLAIYINISGILGRFLSELFQGKQQHIEDMFCSCCSVGRYLHVWDKEPSPCIRQQKVESIRSQTAVTFTRSSSCHSLM